jgi:hypothetical protein
VQPSESKFSSGRPYNPPTLHDGPILTWLRHNITILSRFPKNPLSPKSIQSKPLCPIRCRSHWDTCRVKIFLQSHSLPGSQWRSRMQFTASVSKLRRCRWWIPMATCWGGRDNRRDYSILRGDTLLYVLEFFLSIIGNWEVSYYGRKTNMYIVVYSAFPNQITLIVFNKFFLDT